MIITYFFSVIPKIAVFVLFLRVFFFAINPDYILINYSSVYSFICLGCALFSILIGAVGALYQTKIKRLLAYSAIANMGYILMGCAAISYSGIVAAIYYFLIYLLMSINVFSILIVIRRLTGMLKLKNIVEFVSISHSNFILSFLLVLCLLSLAGVPPLAGFFGKFLIFFVLIDNGQYLLALYAVLFSVLTCVYYIRLVRFLWFVEYDNYPIYFLNSIPFNQAIWISFISIINIFFYFFQGPILIFITDLSILFFNCNFI
jgi:NADH-quinone oxidoreductase subunit N